MNHISIFTFLCFLRQYQRQRKCFLSERELKKALLDTLTRAAWLGPEIFDWFVLSMRMQVILDSTQRQNDCRLRDFRARRNGRHRNKPRQNGGKLKFPASVLFLLRIRSSQAS